MNFLFNKENYMYIKPTILVLTFDVEFYFFPKKNNYFIMFDLRQLFWYRESKLIKILNTNENKNVSVECFGIFYNKSLTLLQNC